MRPLRVYARSCQQELRSTDRFQILSGCRAGGKSEESVKGGRLMHGHDRKRNKVEGGWRCSKAFANGQLVHIRVGVGE